MGTRVAGATEREKAKAKAKARANARARTKEKVSERVKRETSQKPTIPLQLRSANLVRCGVRVGPKIGQTISTSGYTKRIAARVKQFPILHDVLAAHRNSLLSLKDRRAITVQQICAHRLPADQLRRTVLHRSWDRRCRISNLEYRGERLRLGMLRGNSFHIALRGVARDALCSPGDGSSTAKLAFTAVSERGFLNYYGLQRFGTQDVRTHTVGAAIVARRWEEAVRMILGETKADSHKRSATALAEDNSEPDMERKPKVQRTEPKETPEESQPSNTAVAPQLTQDRSSASLASRDGHRKSEIRAAQRLFLESGDAQGALQAMWYATCPP